MSRYDTEDEHSEWSELQWCQERGCWQRTRQNMRNGVISYEYVNNGQTPLPSSSAGAPPFQPRYRPPSEMSTAVTYSTNFNYKVASGYRTEPQGNIPIQGWGTSNPYGGERSALSQVTWSNPLQRSPGLYGQGTSQTSGPDRVSSTASYGDTSINSITRGFKNVELDDEDLAEGSNDQDVGCGDGDPAEEADDYEENPEESAEYYDQYYDDQGATGSGNYAADGDTSGLVADQKNPASATPLRKNISYKKIETLDPSTRKTRYSKNIASTTQTTLRKGKLIWLPLKIFRMLWSEPRGDTAGEDDDGGGDDDDEEKGTELVYRKDSKYGESVYSTIRRFVIVRVREGHCVCVPILTYGKQGTTKPGVKAEYHAVIYSSSKPPDLLKGEPKLGKKPVRVVLNNPREKLRRESRVNYSKLYTVEHNVKVCFIGNIWKDHEVRFFTDFQRVFDE